ncbi:DUF3540 domain-containing protein [Burkholderia plantarii]|uniref:DUF3540 domain-containing protein n=1 Tax=Burkholderia plantarii TaxID=41899 RepID=A0A0B6S9V7_BURPL|nr:DUF3540 domain-containing protein [Burkholderia plantarii]AJK50070.1 hypothetical protein BGL_2c20060 [Burkholderia plantarii]ALK34247.1 hypothetical protein bpln_2g20350 [Burkholderia plantarii]
MMGSPRTTSKLPPPLPLHLVEARVIVALEQHAYLLDDGRVAYQALSCLIRPEVGDHVLVATCPNDASYILHVLHRADAKQVQLSVPGAETLRVEQARIELAATESIALDSLADVEISAATGTLNLAARNLFTTAQDSLVENVGQFVGRADRYLLEVSELLRLHGQQAIVTAEEDVKVDGERISMG